MFFDQAGIIAAAKVAPISSEEKLADFADEINILSSTHHQGLNKPIYIHLYV